MLPAHIISFPGRTFPKPSLAADVSPECDGTAMRIIRKREREMKWEDIQREVLASENERFTAQLASAIAACGKAKRQRSKPGLAPWRSMVDQWGKAALVDRAHESRCRISPLPSSIEALLSTPEWAGAVVQEDAFGWTVSHPSGATLTKKK